MENIQKLTISLLEKVEDSSINQENSEEFIKRSSGSVNINEAISTFSKDVNNVKRENFIDTISDMIYKDLLNKTSNKYSIDNIGIWIELKGKILENSLSLSTLEDMSKYHTDINPIFELIKMTIQKEENS